MNHKKFLYDILSKIPPEDRDQLEGWKFYLDESTIQIGPDDGQFVGGHTFTDSQEIVFYTLVIPDEKEMGRILLHELGHVLGIDHNEMSKKYPDLADGQ